MVLPATGRREMHWHWRHVPRSLPTGTCHRTHSKSDGSRRSGRPGTEAAVSISSYAQVSLRSQAYHRGRTHRRKLKSTFSSARMTRLADNSAIGQSRGKNKAFMAAQEHDSMKGRVRGGRAWSFDGQKLDRQSATAARGRLLLQPAVRKFWLNNPAPRSGPCPPFSTENHTGPQGRTTTWLTRNATSQPSTVPCQRQRLAGRESRPATAVRHDENSAALAGPDSRDRIRCPEPGLHGQRTGAVTPCTQGSRATAGQPGQDRDGDTSRGLEKIFLLLALSCLSHRRLPQQVVSPVTFPLWMPAPEGHAVYPETCPICPFVEKLPCDAHHPADRPLMPEALACFPEPCPPARAAPEI